MDKKIVCPKRMTNEAKDTRRVESLEPTQAEADVLPPGNQVTATQAQNRNVAQPEGWVAPRQHGSLQPPAQTARAVIPSQAVGGTNVGLTGRIASRDIRTQGQRGQDRSKRAPKKCKRCRKYGGTHWESQALQCKGRGRGKCQYYHDDGRPK